MASSIITMPFWSAFTEAWFKNDILWIKKTINQLILFWVGLIIVFIFLFLFSNEFYSLWIGNQYIIQKELSFSLGLYFLFLSFSGIFTMFLNGISDLKFQISVTIIQIILFLPMTLFFIKMGYKMISLSISLDIITLIGGSFMCFRYLKIINIKTI